MNKITYIIQIMALSLLVGSCSMEEEIGANIPPVREDGAVEFLATLGSVEDEPGGSESDKYEANYFSSDDEIRIYCPVSYSKPHFENGAPGMHIYKYNPQSIQESENTDWSNWPYRFDAGIDGGFNWLTLQPTSIYYTFEALHFPGKKYFDKVPANQSKGDSLKMADMLIAYHRQSLDQRGMPVKLTFYHAFAKVKVIVKLPVSQDVTEGPFPSKALKTVYMKDMLTGYEVNYTQVISNDALRNVTATVDSNKGREDVYMEEITCRELDKVCDKDGNPIVDENDKPIKYEEYIFEGIVPAQSFLSEGQDFIYFKVRTHEEGKFVTYRLKPNSVGQDGATLALTSSEVLVLNLLVDKNESELVVLTAEVKPWNKAETNMVIQPKPKSN
ncbi:fimbrillin family protein [Parabacteroides faecis]|uniref:fimbrillin family protein n=1 Tax=Parabacteroides faecis TaxID=1217282 RepID=UPI0021640DBE|nr:fimbrillin family protein [Parabacteroides faecis]MCS2892348.1 fimbrillin family protein [Parabacteroides faecis]UVQ49012.1 fimbrillin family protein [Parabacteroides faecis]